MFLVPLYFQVVRGESAAGSGALLIPQALAAGIAMQIASRLVDRVAPWRVVVTGTTFALVGFTAFALTLDPDVPLWRPVVALAVAGVGTGSIIMPTISTATRRLADADIASGTTLLNMLNQVSVSIGTALATVVLTVALRAQIGASADGGVGELYALTSSARAAAGPDLAAAFAAVLLLTIGLLALSWLCATRLRRPVRT